MVRPIKPPRIPPLNLGPVGERQSAPREPGEIYENAAFADLRLESTDLSTIMMAQCRIRGAIGDEPHLVMASFRDVLIEHTDITALHAASIHLTSVRVEQSRWGVGECPAATWRRVAFVGTKIGYLSLRGARCDDVEFIDCEIGECDINGATLNRVAFTGTTIRTLDGAHARCTDVDLRGAQVETFMGIDGLRNVAISPGQVVEHAFDFALHAGVLVLGDTESF